MFKKILFLFIAIYSSVISFSVFAKQWTSHESIMLPWSGGWVTDTLLISKKWEEQIDEVSSWVISSLETLLPITAVGVFLFVGIKLGMARWNPEEFKKALMQFMYAIIGIFIMSFAWVTVKIVLGLSF
jgi:hypothetical protein